MEKFDYIIVGAGSAGSVLANRLSEDPDATVLLLEAGGSDLNFWVQVPIGYGRVYYDERVNWKYETEPVAGLDGKSSYWPRGKVMGGSSSINAMVYVRGHPRAYDEWAADAPGWGWSDVAPYFQRMENWAGGPDNIRGTGGPLPVRDIAGEAHPLTQTYLDAAAEAGIPTNPDYNGQMMEGACRYQITTANGRRASAARAYLRPALKRANLDMRLHAQVSRVITEAGRAIGVTYRRNGTDHTVHARREVILAGGAINSPQLLMLSGIGPGGHLRDMGIDTIVDRPGVGQNLADHLGFDHMYRSRVPTLNGMLRPWHGKLLQGIKYLLTGRGPLSLSLNQGGGFVRLHEDHDKPDLQLYFSPVSYTRAPVGTRPLMNPDPFEGFLLGFNPCHPKSRGFLCLKSPDPFDAPMMQPNYLDHPDDMDLMIEGSRLMRRIAAAPSFAQVIEEEISPAVDPDDRTAMEAAIRGAAWTVFHQCGTCKMGSDPQTAVVDPHLCVIGIDGLRVADASVFPAVPTGNTNAPAIMVGEKAADLIRADWKG